MRDGITVYVPSFRPSGLQKLVDSIGMPDELHRIVIGIDKGAGCLIPKNDRITVLELPERKPFSTVAAANWMAKVSPPSTHFIFANDDGYFDGNFDSCFRQTLEASRQWSKEAISVPQGKLGLTSDCWFSVLTKWHLEHFGFVVPPEFVAWGGDVWLLKVYAKRTQKLNIKWVHEQTIETQLRMSRLSRGWRRHMRTVVELDEIHD